MGPQGNPTTIVPGNGLSGGGTSSVVTIGVSEGGITTSEILNETIVNSDISPFAGIAGAKINPNFGSQAVSTTGDILAGGGFKMMIGPFHEKDISGNISKEWEIGSEKNPEAVTRVRMPWAGSVMGVFVTCNRDLTGGSLSVVPTVNGIPANLAATISDTGGTNDISASSTRHKDVTTFGAGSTIGCRGTTTSVSPPNADCICAIFVEM